MKREILIQREKQKKILNDRVIKIKEKETGILCFECEKRSGIDCAGRKKEESTRCTPCLLVFIAQNQLEQTSHLLHMLNNGDLPEEDFYLFCKDAGIEPMEY